MFPTRASFFIDLFLIVLVLLIPIMLFSVWLVRRGNVRAHATVMVCCFVAFLLSVIAFEIDVQFIGERVAPAMTPLIIHLGFVLPTLLLWVRQMMTWRRAFENPAEHRRRGRVVIGLLTSSVGTGIWLYVATFA